MIDSLSNNPHISAYLLMPFVAWLITGCTKFAVNCLRARRLAFDLIGYGGFPSNHTSIVVSMAALIAFKVGIDAPAFGVALTLAFIVLLDANSLRRQIGFHAERINSIENSAEKPLRERMGHTKIEILGGAVVGIASAYGLQLFL